MSLRSCFALALAACTTLSVVMAAPMTQDEMTRIVGAFYSTTAIDEGNAFDVKDLTISKDIATFTLKKGTLYLTKPVEGAVSTAVFIGEGTAAIKPTRVMDRQALDMAAKDHLSGTMGGEMNTSFAELVLVSFDGTIESLQKSLSTKAGNPDMTGAGRTLKDRLNTMNTLELPFDFEVLKRSAGMKPDALYVDFKSSQHGWIEYAYSGEQQYEHLLFVLERVGSLINTRTLMRTHLSTEFDAKGAFTGDSVKDQKPWIDVTQYTMEVTIPDTQHFTVETDVVFTQLRDKSPLVFFDLRNNIPVPGTQGTRSDATDKPIVVKKVTDAAGTSLPFVHRKHQIWIGLPTPLAALEESKVHFTLDEETIIQLSSVHYFVLNTYPWFPQHGYLGGQYKMDWTIKTKKPLLATGSGRIIADAQEGAFNTTHLLFDKDVQFPSLIFGQYQKLTDTYKAAPGGTDVQLAVFSWPRTTFNIPTTDGRYVSVDVSVPNDKPRSVLEEAKQIIRFCEQLYGPFPFDQLQIVQMSPGLGFGQAPPGLIQLTGEAFMSSAQLTDIPRLKPDFFHEFFSHEIAHQWWGHVIGWASDEDVWLSESFAEYTAGLYVMQLQGQERFKGKLKTWEDNTKIADAHASIAWANNVSGENGGRYRTALLYDKGPYVVHMLRMLVGHDNFVKSMKGLTEKQRFKPTTTDQLKQEFESVVGYNLDFFFDQWYRGTGIPVFDYSYDVKPTEDGKWLATVRISQRDKEHPKVVSMPVFFHFGKDKVITKERPLLKAEDVYQVKLPEKPDSISLDDFHTILGDIVQQHGATGG